MTGVSASVRISWLACNYMLMTPPFLCSAVCGWEQQLQIKAASAENADEAETLRLFFFPLSGPKRCRGGSHPAKKNTICKPDSLWGKFPKKQNIKVQIAPPSERVSTCRFCSCWNILIEQAEKATETAVRLYNNNYLV